jgi:hypothetical protein
MENMNTNESVDAVSIHASLHTPGPWRQGGVKELSPTGKCREIVADDGRIGLVYGITDEDCKANAKLIAAAPTMLNALRRIVRHQDLIGGSMASMSSTRHIAAQAIQHATGEAV